MPQGRRVDRVASLLRRELSNLLLNGIHDERVSQHMVSITDVEVSGDLQHCKVFVSIFGDKTLQKDVIAGLQGASGFIRAELGRRLQMRRVPELTFLVDRALEKGTSIISLLDKLEEERESKSLIIEDISEDS